jgi:hypothetical protein
LLFAPPDVFIEGSGHRFPLGPVIPQFLGLGNEAVING